MTDQAGQSDEARRADEDDAEAEHVPGRGPTTEEEAAADRAREDVDLDTVGEREREMDELGADVRGEGRPE